MFFASMAYEASRYSRRGVIKTGFSSAIFCGDLETGITPQNWIARMTEYTPIHRAAISGDVAALRRELEAGVPPDQHPSGGYNHTTPLSFLLCANSWEFGAGHVACVKLLLAAGASPNVSRASVSWLCNSRSVIFCA